MKNKKIIILVGISALVSLFSMLGVTYALLFQSHTFENAINYNTSSLELSMDYENKFILNELPMTDNDAQKIDLYKVTINNNGKIPYLFNLKMLSTVDTNIVDLKYIKVQIITNDNDILCKKIEDNISCPNLKELNNTLISDKILSNNEKQDVYIRLWLDINTPNTEIGKTFTGKLVLDAISYFDVNIDNEEINNNVINNNIVE